MTYGYKVILRALCRCRLHSGYKVILGGGWGLRCWMNQGNKDIEVGLDAALRIIQVKMLFKGLKCRYVKKGYKVILEGTM